MPFMPALDCLYSPSWVALTHNHVGVLAGCLVAFLASFRALATLASSAAHAFPGALFFCSSRGCWLKNGKHLIFVSSNYGMQSLALRRLHSVDDVIVGPGVFL